jgi:hypothetical protein
MYPFMGFEHKTDEWILFKRAPKVFRKTFSIQRESLACRNKGESIPGIFNQPNIRDVSSEYFQGTDVTIKVHNPGSLRSKTVYLCVFNNRDWMAVHWAKIKRNRATFTCMQKEMVYLPAFYNEKRFIAVNDPVLIDSLGEIIFLKPDFNKKETLLLKRKYHPDKRSREVFLPRMLNSRFMAANKPDFSDETTLYQIKELPEVTFNTIDIAPLETYRYIRYRAEAPNDSEIAELELYTRDKNGTYRKLNGRIIGTEGAIYDPLIFGKEKAFDGDWVSYFSHRTEAWVGLDFGKKEKIDRIRFLPRNDDNNIHDGDLYELFYWNDGKWNSLGRQTGTDRPVLVYDHCPANALYLLRNHTRGKEERIFTYENNKQVWW